MPASFSERELSDLDFTETVMMCGSETNGTADPTEHLLTQLDAIVDAIALKVEFGSVDERLWRVLAGVYMAMERITDYNDLVRKHLTTFGQPLKLDQPGVTFALPSKVNVDDIPNLNMIRTASASPGGATIDFSLVRRISSGGLIALAELLLALMPVSMLPQLRGIEVFVGSVEAVIKSGQGTKEMQDFVSAYRRFSAVHPHRQDDAVTAAVA